MTKDKSVKMPLFTTAQIALSTLTFSESKIPGDLKGKAQTLEQKKNAQKGIGMIF